MENRKRNVHLHVMVTPDELAAIHERMAEAGMPKPAQSLSSIRRRSTAGNSLRSMRPTLNCTGVHKRKCALCWEGRSSLKWMC